MCAPRARIPGEGVTNREGAGPPCVRRINYRLAGGCHKQPPAVEVRPNFPQGRETVGEHGPLRVFLDPNS